MSQQSNDALFQRVATKYPHFDLMKRDVLNAQQHYKGLKLKLQNFVFNDGSENELLNLDGTIPVPFKGTTYNIPIVIWLLDSHPYNPPMCYVKPTQTMLIKVSRHVDQTGKVYLPYLHEWKYGSSDLLGVIQVMIIVFGEMPPVYSRSAVSVQPASVGSTPYPPYPGSYMPMPNVGGPVAQPPRSQATYPPAYQSNSQPASNYIPNTNYPYPNSTQSSYPSSGYPPYPSYPPSTASYPPSSSTAYAASNNGGYAPQYSTASMGQHAPSSNNGSGNEQRLIHLSAVENKLRQKLDETFSQLQAENEVLKKTKSDLTNGQSRLNEIVGKLQDELGHVDHNIRVLKDKSCELSDVLDKMDAHNDIDIDEAVTTTAPLYKQLLQLYAEENATQDAIYYLGEGLKRGVIDLDIFLKHVRELSRKQFMLRALMHKCREKAGLAY